MYKSCRKKEKKNPFLCLASKISKLKNKTKQKYELVGRKNRKKKKIKQRRKKKKQSKAKQKRHPPSKGF